MLARPSRTRPALALAALLLMASACTEGGGDPLGLDRTPTTRAPGGGDGSPGGGDGGGGGGPPPATVEDSGGVGANGPAILRGSIPYLIIEVDFQDGVKPSEEALDYLANVLGAVVDKPEGISFQGGNQFSSPRTSWTTQDLRDAAATNRTRYSHPGRVVIYLLYVRGGFAEDDEETSALGVAYSASEVGIFPERWSGLGMLLGGGDAVERAVVTHEAGHLLGLVNLTYTSDAPHEDPDHPGHSASDESVMFWAVDTTAVGQLFSGPPPDAFDADDLADLEGLKSGRY
ncbi:MAG: hypothetical protein WD770_07310 [Actinomycetota bacterium]